MIHRAEGSYYRLAEEVVNIASHAAACLLSIAALIALVRKALARGSLPAVISFSVFGICLLVTYGTSTLYHSHFTLRTQALRARLRIMDHASIYLLIAGTYTPFTLITLKGMTGWIIFGVSWSMALTGIVLKLFFTGRYSRLSTAMYVFMGWLILFAIVPLIESLSAQGLRWLVAGGIAYSVGAVIYSIRAIPFNHAIFHILTMLGSACHFMAVYFHVLV